MQEFFLNLKPNKLVTIWAFFMVLSIVVVLWAFKSLEDRVYIYLLAVVCASSFYAGWHYAVGTFLLNRCKTDLGFFAKYYKPISLFCYVYRMLFVSVMLTFLIGRETPEGEKMYKLFIILFPVQLLVTLASTRLTRAQAKALVEVEKELEINQVDYNKTQRNMRSIFKLAYIQKRIQVIRDKTPFGSSPLSGVTRFE